MKIYFNNRELELPRERFSVAELLDAQGVVAAGIAVAVNEAVIRKPLWADTLLAQGDRVIVITAVCGG